MVTKKLSGKMVELFPRNFGSTAVGLTTMAPKIFGIALSNEAAEIKRKHYKR